MRVLFIGGTGNISSECTRHLFESGHEISVLTRGTSEVPSEYKAIRGDRRDAASMQSLAVEAKADVVINFIGYEPADVRLDHSVFRERLSQYAFISSTTVHARPAKLPITEDAPIGNAFWEYARKKAECEQWLMDRWREEAFPVTIIRPSHTYSKRWIPNAIASSNHTFADRLLKGRPVFVHDQGETRWTLTAASDFAAGLAGLIGRKETLGEAFHITSDEALSWNQIYAHIAAALGVSQPVIEKVPVDVICAAVPGLTGTLKGDKAHPGVFDNAKLKRFVPGFRCRVPFQEGIRESVEWLRAESGRWKADSATNAIIETVLSSWAAARR